MGSGNKRYHLLAFVVVAIWGVTFISTKVLIQAGLLPAQIFAIRFSIAYVGIWLLCLKNPETRRLFAGSLRDELLLILLGITGGSMYFYTENTALSCTQACNVAFIVCIAPLITALLTIVAKRVLKGELFATRKVFFYGLVTIIPFIAGTEFDPHVLSVPKVWGNLLFLSLMASLLYFVLWNKVMAHLGNITSTNYVYLNPFFTLVSAVLILGETLTLQSAIGCAAIIAGVIIGGIKTK